MSKKAQQICAFVFGVFFLLTLLAIALFEPNPTPFQYFVFRTILALAAGGVAAMIPGFIQAQLGKLIRAGGAIAAFVVVYYFSPAELVSTPKPLKEHEGFLSALDEHFFRRVPSNEYQLDIVRRSDVDVGRFWISAISDETWNGLFLKICSRYKTCLDCSVDENKAKLEFKGELQDGVTPQGAKFLSCKV